MEDDDNATYIVSNISNHNEHGGWGLRSFLRVAKAMGIGDMVGNRG